MEIWLGPCAKGFAHAWLKGWEAPAYSDLESQDHAVDAPWPVVVETAAGEKRPGSMKEAAEFTLEDQELVADILDIPETKSALRGLSELGPITADELSGVSPDLGNNLSPEQAERVLHWASRLGIAQRDDKGYRLDTAYAIGSSDSLRTEPCALGYASQGPRISWKPSSKTWKMGVVFLLVYLPSVQNCHSSLRDG